MGLSLPTTPHNLIIAAAIAAALTACSASPNGASKNFYRAVGTGNTDKAMKMIDMVDIGPQAQLMGLNSKIRAAIESLHQKAQAHGGLASVEILSVHKIDDTHSKVTAELRFRDGTTQNSTDTWAKLHGKWLLDLAQT